MRKSELEQRLRESDYRISKLTERIEQLEQKNSVYNMDEVYQCIENRKHELVKYIDDFQEFSNKRHQSFSDEIYGHVAKQNAMRDERFLKFQQEVGTEQGVKQDLWMTQYTYDKMISEIQMRLIEQISPGNRNKLISLQNTHVGEKCFVIGNGPSLKAEDLDKLREKNVFSLASKGIYTIFKQTEWRPDIWGVSDLDYIELKQDAINELVGFPKLVCAQSVIAKGILIKDAIYYPFIQAERQPRFFNIDILNGVHFYGTITGKLINFAAYMGFKEIYLLGCDTTFPIKKTEIGKTIIDTTSKTHFSDNYFDSSAQEDMAYKNIDDMEKSMEYVLGAYKDIKYYCEQLNVKIYNATRGGGLEVFERVNFDDQIESM